MCIRDRLVTDMRLYAKTLFYQGLAQLLTGFLQQDEQVLTELNDSLAA